MLSNQYDQGEGVQKTIILIVDGLGIGPSPDTSLFQNIKTNTLSHLSEYTNKPLPCHTLSSLGLSNLTFVKNYLRIPFTSGFYGKVKCTFDYTLPKMGYMSLLASDTFINSTYSYLNELSLEFLNKIEAETSYKFLGNVKGDTHQILEKYGQEHLSTKQAILYLTPDSALNIAVDISVVELNKIYMICDKLSLFVEKYGVTRVVVRTFKYENSTWQFAPGMRIFNMFLSNSSLLESLDTHNIQTYSVGCIAEMVGMYYFREVYSLFIPADIFKKTAQLLRLRDKDEEKSVIFVTLEQDFYYRSKFKTQDSKVDDYIHYLKEVDHFVQGLMHLMHKEDILFITSLFSSDPLMYDSVSYYTREYLPLLVYSPTFKPYNSGNLGIRYNHSDIAKTVAEAYSINLGIGYGVSFWQDISSKV